MATKYYCDICGKEIHPSIMTKHLVGFKNTHNVESVAIEINPCKYYYKQKDLCAECIIKVVHDYIVK